MKRITFVLLTIIIFSCSAGSKLIDPEKGIGIFKLNQINDISPVIIYDGSDKFIEDSGLRVFYSSNQFVFLIIVLTSDYFTERNINVGDSASDVIKSYPDAVPSVIDIFEDDNFYNAKYYFENYKTLISDGLIFILDNDIVCGIAIGDIR